MRTSELSVLEQIIVRKRAELVAQRSIISEDELAQMPRPKKRPFREALEAAKPAVIAEIKKASPSAGVISENFEPAKIALGYEQAGAAALSVLTDRQFFEGALEHLELARAATRIPVLRKDFTLERYHLLEAASAGADAVLLIVAALTDDELRRLMEQARELELAPLVEVHNEEELDRAVEAGADLVGVNNRNLKTLEVDVETSLRLAEKMPEGVLAVSESGLRGPEDLHRLMQAGFQAFLIGESLMREGDPGEALARLIEGTRALAA